MSFEKTSGHDDRYELHERNVRKVEQLMGEDYNPYEIPDYFSHLSPETGEQEIAILEAKLKRGGEQKRKEIIAGFKAHLAYLTANN